MIYKTANIIREKLDHYLRKRFQLHESAVVLNNIIDIDGSVPVETENKIILTIVNLQEETVLKNIPAGIARNDNRIGQYNRPNHFNLYILISAYFKDSNYDESLKFLSETLNYFQAVPYFTHQNMPELDRNIEKLVFEIVNLNIADLSHLWSIMGGKYLPSVLYKVRMIKVDMGEITADKTAMGESYSDIFSNQ